METNGVCSETTLPAVRSTQCSLRSGEQLTIRLLQPGDAARLGAYLHGLSAETRARYGPHAFDQATVDAICSTLNPAALLRMVGTVAQGNEERIISYALLKLGVLDEDRRRYEALAILLSQDTDCTLAPSVADAYQDQGVGSLMMGHLLRVARELGRKRVVLWLGVQATNERAIHFYTKWGFAKVGEFMTDRNNFDMIRDL